MQNRILLVLLLFTIPTYGFCKKENVQTIVMDSVQAARYIDSIRQLRLQEIDFIVDQIENTYISGRRGLNNQEWKDRLAILRDAVTRTAHAPNFTYYYMWCYLGFFIQDQHFKFPDGGMYNRYRIFTEDDELLPLWVQTWKDGTVYNVKDYTGIIPAHAQILSVNGRDAQETALRNRMMFPGEGIYAMEWMNTSSEPNPLNWNTFANFFWMRGYRPPFELVYKAQGSDRPDTVVLNGMTRGDIYKEFKKSGAKHRARASVGSHRRPIEYRNMQDGIGVLTT